MSDLTLIQNENNNEMNDRLEKSKALLMKLDTYSCITEKNPSYIKEEIGACTKCNKMIALKYTQCSSCNKPFCKNHREAHQCEMNQLNCARAKIEDGKHAFQKRLKAIKIKAGVI
jgi:predicted amidophosphoribosyltransferase